jgi:predicted nucleic acid-binding protein
VFLLDTNVIAEVRKSDGDPGVHAWFESVADDSLFLSALVLGEIQRGIRLVEPRDAMLAGTLQEWLDQLRSQYHDRLLPIDADVALVWGRLSAIRSVPDVDGLLAATALHHGMTLVTRNVQDFDGLGVTVLNPFTHG